MAFDNNIQSFSKMIELSIVIFTELVLLFLFLTYIFHYKELAKITQSIPSTGSVEADPSYQISVHLDPTSPDYYFTGQTVSGAVLLNSSYRENIEYEDFFVKVTGCAEVFYYNGLETYIRKSESFLFLKIPLVKENSCFDQVTERHYFPFSFVIPRKSPTSFESENGHVRYSMKAVLKRKHFTRLVSSSKVLFKCQRTVDLTRNALMLLRQPGFQKKYENLIKSIKVTAWLDNSAYIPGENIQFNAKIENGSGESVKFTTVKFVQYTTFTDGRVNYQSTKTLWEQRAGKICSNKEQIWDNVLIPVAFVPPTGYPFCGLIKTSYAIKVYLGILCKKYLEINVMIGTTHIPEINRRAEVLPSLISESPNSGSIQNDNLAGGNSSCADPPPPYFSCVPHRHLDIPPPTYDSVFESTDLYDIINI